MTSRGAAVDLWRALRPLLLPLAGIALIGAFGYGGVVLAGAFVIFAVLVAYVAFRSVRSIRQYARLSAVTEAWVTVAASLALTLPLVMLGVYLWLGSDDAGLFDEYELWSRALVWVAFVAWFGALLFRLPMFACTLRRRIFAVVLMAAFVRFFAGIAVGGSTALTLADVVVWPLLLVTLMLVEIHAEGEERVVPDPGRFAQATQRGGLVLTLVATVAFVVAGVLGIASDPPSQRVKPFPQQVAKTSPALARPDVSGWIADPRAERLVERFTPVLELTDKQRWAPTSVDWFLQNADLLNSRRRPLKAAPVTPEDLDRTCAGSRPCYALTIRCSLDDSYEEDCEGANHPAEAGTGAAADRSPPTAYVRVVRKRDRPQLFPPVGPYRDELELLVQYWLFYAYDDWRSRILFGSLHQSHEGDWEAVTIGFSKRHPLFVAMTAHCGGTWVPWGKMRISDPKPGEFHPLVAVAEGSQANYHVAGADIASNWLDCKGGIQSVFTAAQRAYKIRDRTGVSAQVRPYNLIRFEDVPEVMRFPGVWGLNGEMHLEAEFGRRHRLDDSQDGPATPRFQAPWRDPVRTFFASRGWKRR